MSLPNLEISSICTLFEGNYLKGVAVLVNSLYRQGFRGDIYIGYKGLLSGWAAGAKFNPGLCWSGGQTLEVKEDLLLHFLPLDTDYHLTNYKPDFMLRLWEGPAKSASHIFYFDPDIVVTAPWTFFSQWVGYGVALCEDVNSPLPEFHPKRVEWRRYFERNGIKLVFKENIYVNGGFIGVSEKNRAFLQVWKAVQEAMAKEIGGLHRSSLKGTALLREKSGPFAPFGKTDQDALNAAIEGWEGKASLIGKEGMAFDPGAVVMPHALGQPKPWSKNFLSAAIDGRPPSKADKEYWVNTTGLIRIYNPIYIKLKWCSILLASFIGRFYRRY